MSLTTPTTSELSDQIVAHLEASFSQTIPLLPKLFQRVLAKVLAGSLVLIYRYAGFTHLQQYVATASTEPTTVNGITIRPLVEWGRQVGVGDPNPGKRAELTVDVAVLNQTGSLSAGQKAVRADTGVVYQVVFDVALDAATVSATVRAVDDVQGTAGVGTIGNLSDGETIEFANPPAQISAVATVTGTAVTGTNAETWPAYRKRIQRHEQAKPQGGAYADYREWAEEADNVINAYPYTGNPGEVDVYIEADSSVDADGIASSTEITAAENAIEFDAEGKARRRPVNALVNVFSITRIAFGVEVFSLTPSDPTQLASVQASISAAVDEFLRSREPFIAGLSVLPRLDRITQGEVAGVVYEVCNAAGATVSAVGLQEGGTTFNARTLGQGEKAKLGSVSYH